MRFRVTFALALALGVTTSGFAADAPKAAPAPKPAGFSDPAVEKWCTELLAAMKGFRGQREGCKYKDWKVGGHSIEKRPLVYAEFGNPSSKNTTLVLAMVHVDEITPLYL